MNIINSNVDIKQYMNFFKHSNPAYNPTDFKDVILILQK